MTRLLRVIEGWGVVNLALLKLAKWIITILIGAMTAVIAVQVIFRYVLNDALPWTEEVARYLMVWMTFLGVPIMSWKLAHSSITLILDAMPGATKNLLLAVLQIMMLIVLIYGIQYAWAYAVGGLKVMSSSVPLPKFYAYISVPVGFVLTASVTAELLARNLADMFSADARTAFGDLGEQAHARVGCQDL